ncbi:MAG: hypothetical protein V1787_01295 [Candidatus Micrarchaeota archaeon]
MEERDEGFLSEDDLLIAFNSAARILNLDGYFVKARFHNYAGLKSTVYADANKIISARVSDGFRGASDEAALGLALELLSKAFRRTVPSSATRFVDSYDEAFDGQSAMRLHDSLRRTRGRRRKGGSKGRAFDLEQVLAKVLADYPLTFNGLERPFIHWSREKSRQRLAFYDSAFNDIVVSRTFDLPTVPQYVLEYLVFHELLHAKHDLQFKRGRKRVHHPAFKRDERRFALFAEADEFLDRCT